jgi:hypothetical protein
MCYPTARRHQWTEAMIITGRYEFRLFTGHLAGGYNLV